MPAQRQPHLLRTAQSVHTRGSFVWLLEDRAIYSYGPTYHPEFYSVSKASWEQLGEPEFIEIVVRALD